MANVRNYHDWLPSLFTIINGHPYCRLHNGYKNTKSQLKFFCTNCRLQICEYCKLDHEDCDMIIQLRKGTPDVDPKAQDGKKKHNLSIETKHLFVNGKTPIILEDVAKYSFNGREIYYIFNRKKTSHGSYSCKECGHSISPPWRFCSLECNSRSIEVIEIRPIVVPNSIGQERNPLPTIVSNGIKDVEDDASVSDRPIEETSEKPLEGTSAKIYRQHPKKQTQPIRSDLGNTFHTDFRTGQTLL